MQYIQITKEKLPELVALWNQELGRDFPMRAKLFTQNSFDDINVYHEASIMAVDENQTIKGFIIAKKWQDPLDVGISKTTGWIQVLLVDRNHRNQGIGTKLLEHAEDKLKKSGIDHIWLGKDTWHYFPGIPVSYSKTQAWFEMRGYKKVGEEFDLDCHYQHDGDVKIPAKAGVELTLLSAEEQAQFIEFMQRCFPGRWEYEARQYFAKGGTGREFVVLKKNHRIIGFCRINDSQSPVIAQNVYWADLYSGEHGGVGPLGIDANERQHGYGLLIVEAAVSFLRNRKIDSILIDWTGLVSFYQKLGFEVCKSYYSYEKYL